MIQLDLYKFLLLVKPLKFTVLFFNNNSFHLIVPLKVILKILSNHAIQQDRKSFKEVFKNLSNK